jgi:hypothetical protein
LKKTIRNAKLEYYNKIFTKHKFDSKKTWELIHTILNNKNRLKEFPEYFKVNEEKIYDEKTIAEKFNSFFANIGSDLAAKIHSNSNKSINDFLTEDWQCKFNFMPVNALDIKKVIKKLPNKNSSGHDDLSNKLIKHITEALAEPLSLIVNQSFCTGIFPDLLKLSKVIPIFKKDDDFIFTNYRPISLLPVISKIFEKISYLQLYDYLIQNNLIYNGQHGFRTRHSTETAAYELIDRVNNSLDNGLLPVAVYLDLSKAFDTLDHTILLTKLKYYGLQNKTLSWFYSYLSNRYQYTVYKDSSSPILPLSTGVPQGSILGPLLFLIYVNDICKSSDKLDMILYADDTTILFPLSPATLHADINILNMELASIHEWLLLNKLSLNIGKTKYMLYHLPQRHIDFSQLPSIHINNINITRSKEFNFLGLTINENLNWKPHIDKISNKLARVCGIMKRMQKTLPPYVLRTIYNSLFLPHLNYCVLAWGNSCSRVVKLQKKAIRYINNSKYNAHTSPLFKLNYLLKISDIYTLQSLKFYFKYNKEDLPHYFSTIFHPISNNNPYNTRNRLNPIAQLPRKSSCGNCIRYITPTIVSNIPQCIQEKFTTHSLQGFSWYIKRYVISNYPVECTIPNCYICNQPADNSQQ